MSMTNEQIAEEFIRAGTAAFWRDEWCARLVAHPLRALIIFIMERQSGFDISSSYDGGCVQ